MGRRGLPQENYVSLLADFLALSSSFGQCEPAGWESDRILPWKLRSPVPKSLAPKTQPGLGRKARFALGSVLALAFSGSIGWILLGWPLPMRLWVALVLAAGLSFAGLILIFIPKELPSNVTRALAGGTGVILLIAAVMAVQGADSPSAGDGGQTAPQTSGPVVPGSTPAIEESRPSGEPDPLITTADFDLELCENFTIPESLVPALPKKYTDFDPKWIYEHGGASIYGFRLTVEGKTDSAVVLNRFRVIDIKRKAPPADAVHLQPCGPAGGSVILRQVDVNLGDPVKVTSVPYEDPITATKCPLSTSHSRFPTTTRKCSSLSPPEQHASANGGLQSTGRVADGLAQRS
jgi:hypothetical protein